MKIQVHQKNANDGDVFVMGLYGPKTTQHMLELITKDIEMINSELKATV